MIWVADLTGWDNNIGKCLNNWSRLEMLVLMYKDLDNTSIRILRCLLVKVLRDDLIVRSIICTQSVKGGVRRICSNTSCRRELKLVALQGRSMIVILTARRNIVIGPSFSSCQNQALFSFELDHG
jgi:hypothetical protein